MNTVPQFWQTKKLAELTPEQWESLCDGCGKCCLHKLEDEDSGEIYYTDVACRFLDSQSCRCRDYENRLNNVPSCLTLTADTFHHWQWLPDTCSYRLLAQGQSLPSWHPLITGEALSVRRAGMSVAGRVVSEDQVQEDCYEDHIIRWVD